jgi:hypothetical protein
VRSRRGLEHVDHRRAGRRRQRCRAARDAQPTDGVSTPDELGSRLASPIRTLRAVSTITDLGDPKFGWTSSCPRSLLSTTWLAAEAVRAQEPKLRGYQVFGAQYDLHQVRRHGSDLAEDRSAVRPECSNDPLPVVVRPASAHTTVTTGSPISRGRAGGEEFVGSRGDQFVVELEEFSAPSAPRRACCSASGVASPRARPARSSSETGPGRGRRRTPRCPTLWPSPLTDRGWSWRLAKPIPRTTSEAS